MEKIYLGEKYPREGFYDAEDHRFYKASNMEMEFQLKPGSKLWGLAVVSGTTRRADFNSSVCSRGDLFSANGVLQLPSGGTVEFNTYPRNHLWVSDWETEIKFDSQYENEVKSCFNLN